MIIAAAGGSILFFWATAMRRGPAVAGRDFFVTKKADSGRLQVTASFYPLYFFAKEITGDKADVYNLTPAGAEPHDYELTAGDRARIEDSELLILNGGKLEPWGDRVRTALTGSRTRVVAVGGNGADPHVWLDPRLAKIQARSILEALVAVDPTAEELFQNNFNLLEGKMDALDREYRATLTNCEKKDIITTHAAFGYLADEYGLNQIGISGLSPDEEPSSGRLVEIAEFVRKNNIKYIFFETLVSPKLAETIAHEVGAETLQLNPLEGISDADARNGKNYFTEMEKNLANLRIALECP